MAKRNEFGGLFCGGDAGNARDLQWIALGILGSCATTSGCMRTKAWARAERLVGDLPETSTMRAAPASSKWLSFFFIDLFQQDSYGVAGRPVFAAGFGNQKGIGARQSGHVARSLPWDRRHLRSVPA